MPDGVIPDQSVLAELLDYDPATGDIRHRHRKPEMFTELRRWKAWNTRHAGKNAVNRVDTEGYSKICLFDSRCFAHRVIWKLIHGVEPRFIDHINGDRSDNRLSNLREVAFFENSRNRKRPSNNTSGVIGVSWNKGMGRWIAFIRDGENRTVKYFADKDEAIESRRAMERELGFHENHGR